VASGNHLPTEDPVAANDWCELEKLANLTVEQKRF
jgi:hypothetical protein